MTGERVEQPALNLRLEAGGGDDRSTGHPADRRHARYAGGTVDENGAAAALALGAAAVLDRFAEAQALPESTKQRDVVACDLDG